MRRRSLLALGAGAVLAAPGVLRGQPLRPILIAALSPDPTEFFPEYLAVPFRQTMQAGGWAEDRDYTLRAVSTGGSNAGLPEAARQLIAQQPAVFLAFGDGAIRAAQAVTSSIPIAAIADDMVGSGLVASLARPGGNTTGVSILASELDAKRLAILHELAPQAVRLGALADPTTVSTRDALEQVARRLGVELVYTTADNAARVPAAIQEMTAAGISGLDLCASPILYSARAAIFDVVAALQLPAIYQLPEAADEGGLAAYGTRFTQIYRLLADQVVRILKGAQPADLPVQQPTKFELVINLKTATALGLTVPQSLLARADEVIE